jgi:hypothetical protein
MKKGYKYFFIIVAALLLISMSVLFTGCNLFGKPAGNKKAAVKDAPEKAKNTIDTKDEDNEIMDALEGISDMIEGDVLERVLEGGGITVEGWPEGKIPAEIPEYKKGKVVNSGGSEEEYTILVETNREELKEYLDQLESFGWYVDRDDRFPMARNKNISLDFQFNSKTLLQISIYVQMQGSWPGDELPPDVFPPDKGTLVGEVVISDVGEREDFIYYITYDYEGLSNEDVGEYMQKLIDKGWQGDEYMVSKIVEWKGSRFEASIEVMEYQGVISFISNLRKLQ